MKEYKRGIVSVVEKLQRGQKIAKELLFSLPALQQHPSQLNEDAYWSRLKNEEKQHVRMHASNTTALCSGLNGLKCSLVQCTLHWLHASGQRLWIKRGRTQILFVFPNRNIYGKSTISPVTEAVSPQGTRRVFHSYYPIRNEHCERQKVSLLFSTYVTKHQLSKTVLSQYSNLTSRSAVSRDRPQTLLRKSDLVSILRMRVCVIYSTSHLTLPYLLFLSYRFDSVLLTFISDFVNILGQVGPAR